MADINQLKKLSPEDRQRALKSMSTEDLLKLKASSASAPAQQSAPSLTDKIKSLSTEELVQLRTMSPTERNQYLAKGPEKGFLSSAAESIGSGISKVGSFVDSYTGAPARAAVGAMLPDYSAPGFVRDLESDGKSFAPIEAAKAYAKQFGEDPAQAPTGEQLAGRMGFSRDKGRMLAPGFLPDPAKTIEGPSASDVAGFALDAFIDPTNLIPFSAVAKVTGRAGTTAAKAGYKAILAGSAKAVELAEEAAKGSANFERAKKIGGVIADASRSSKAAMGKLFNPKVAEDFKDLAQIAEKNGIPLDVLPESVEFGPTSIISRASRVKREGLLGQESFEKFQDGLNRTQAAVDQTLAKISDGPVLNRVEAGQLLRDSFDRGADKIFDNADMTYSTVIKQYPGLKIAKDAMQALESDIAGLERFAIRRAKRGFSSGQRSQGQQMLNNIEALRASNGSFKQMVESLRDIGEIAFKNSNALEIDPPDIVRLRKLYGDIKESLIQTIKTDVKDGEQIAGALQISNGLLSDFFTDKSVVSKTLGNKSLGPERVFDNLIKNGDSRKIEALKAVVSKEDWQQIKASFVDSLIKRENDGSFSFTTLKSAMEKKRDLLEIVLTPKELSEVSDIVRLGDRFGIAVMSTSGTGASNIFKDILKGSQEAVTNDAFIQALKDRARAASNPVFGPPKPPPLKPQAPSFLEMIKAGQTPLDQAVRAARLKSIQDQEKQQSFQLPRR